MNLSRNFLNFDWETDLEKKNQNNLNTTQISFETFN